MKFRYALGLERLIRNQKGLSKMYINDTDKDSQYMAKYYSDIADEYEEELKRRNAIEMQTAV
ncbi:MAG: hypothetical protein KFW21_06040 [Spirochaetota bacterium]|nr:hypothetical protein [Spirochaetota bacterium]